jgi:opacity protein-like surface antigen
MSPPLRVLCTLALAAAIGICLVITPDGAWARKAAVSGDWAGVSSDLLEWPQDQFGLKLLVGPFFGNLYVLPGAAVSHGGERDLTTGRGYLNLRYMLPFGDKVIPYIEGGVTGTALRLDVLDHTGEGPTASVKRETYLRGGFEFGAGVDLALGGNWSISAEIKSVWLGDIDTDLVLRGGRSVYRTRDPSFREVPRISLVYWF